MATLSTNIQYLKGVGEKRARLYARLGITTIGDLLNHYPRDYIDFSHPSSITGAPTTGRAPSALRLQLKRRSRGSGRGFLCLRSWLRMGKATCLSLFFNTKYTAAALKEEETYLFYGRVSGRIGRREMSSPLVFADDPTFSFFPVYPLTEGLSSKMIAANVRQALALTEGLDRDLLLPPSKKPMGFAAVGRRWNPSTFPPMKRPLPERVNG